MIQFLQRKIGYYQFASRLDASGGDSPPPSYPKMTASLEKNLSNFYEIIGKSNDIIQRDLVLGEHKQIKGALLYIDGLVNSQTISDNIIHPLLLHFEHVQVLNNIDEILNDLIFIGEVKKGDSLEQIFEGIMSGDTALLLDGTGEFLILNSRGWERRSVTEPMTEAVIRGPREGFTENFRTNTALLRRILKTTTLRMDSMAIGQRTKTNVCVAYLEDVARPEMIEQIKKRLKSIDIDAVLESGYLEEFLEDSPFSVFPTVGFTEKPDVAAGKILEGRAAVIVDGTPFVLTVPMLFIETMQTAEDYYSRTLFASAIRILHYIAYFIATMAPALYIAFSTYHAEMIPTTLLFAMISNHEKIPFPGFLEILILLLAFEILREAGLRLPRPIGQAVSIVGALVMGEAAVSAGLVAPATVIVVAITAVAGFVIPQLSEPVILLRYLFLIMGGILGGFGIMIAFLGLLVYLASLSPFGVPYTSGVAPLNFNAMKDVFIRAPLRSMTMRPQSIATNDIRRQKPPKSN